MSQPDNSVDELLTDARTALKARDYEGASRLLRAVIEIDPDNEEAQRLMRFARTGLGKTSRSGATNPSPLARARQRHGSARKKKTQTAPSGVLKRADGEGASERSDDEKTAIVRESLEKAKSLYEQRQFDDCLHVLERVLELDPDNDEARRFKRFAKVGLRSESKRSASRESRQTRPMTAFKVLKPRSRKKPDEADQD